MTAERRRVLAVVGLFVAAWLTSRALFEIDVRFSDVPLFRTYGEAIANGSVPYRDFALEYPPGALPLFVLPALASSSLDGFSLVLEMLLIASGATMLAAMNAILVRLRASAIRTWAPLVVAALSPLLLGRVLAERYDLWPAALAVVALAAALASRHRTAGAALAVGTAAKLFPIVLLPFLGWWAWRRDGRRDGLRFFATFVLVALVCVLPFVAASPGGVESVVERQVERPLQIESLGAALMLGVHHVAGLQLGTESSYGSINLGGRKAAAAAAMQSLLLLVVLVFLGVRLTRVAPSAETLVVVSAAAVTALVVLGKVLSPQFLVWALPFVPLVGGRKGLLASALLGAAMVVTQLYFPSRYLDLIALGRTPSAIVLLRDLLLVASLAVLLAAFGERTRVSSADTR